MADRKISDLTALTAPASGDYLPIVDISEAAAASKNKRITIQSLFQGIPVNVGIGTSSPARALDVTPSSVNAVAARFGNVAGRGLEISTFLTQTVNDAGVAFNALGAGVGAIAFQTDSTERVRIDSSGRVGIGTSSPAANLSINNIAALASVPALGTIGGLFSATVGNKDYGLISGALNSGAYFFQAQITNGAATAYPILLNPSGGNVGIGTSSPTENLTIYGTGSRLAVTGESSGSAILLGNQNSGGVNNPAVIFAANGELYFGGGSSWSGGGTLDYNMFISDSGNVGIGTTTPTTLLDVNADTVRVRTARTPASATATGATGEICWDANYIYVCTATNTWKRSAISTW